LQRLIVSRAFAKVRLREVLEALREATSAGLDVQLKILQALPSLFQNYADDLKGELLAAALNICTILQASKNGIVNNTAAATLQQLVVSVFDKVVAEDSTFRTCQTYASINECVEISLQVPTVGEAPTEDGPVQLRAAALDAYKVFDDLCLLTEAHKPRFLKSSGIPQTFGLELIESVLTNHADIYLTHPEQAATLRKRVMPFIIQSLSERLNFPVTVRIVRILYTLLRRHLSILKTEGGTALSLLTHMLDQDTALWKRSLCMEVLRGIFADAALVRQIFAMYDSQKDGKPILRDLVSAFVRISTEKPALIGLSHQSTIPMARQGDTTGSDQVVLEASGIPGIISSSGNTNDFVPGISTQWSTMRVPCIDQLDKSEPPSVPDTYIYNLTLACISGFSEGLAKFILPLTVPERPRKKARQSESVSKVPDAPTPDSQAALERQTSFKKNPVPVNPLLLEEHPRHEDVQLCAGIVDDCWPALLATCSTFLYSALDSEYYHGLVRSFQKFTHVAGLLRLATPRDAFLTTLGKSAVPANVLTASTTQTQAPQVQPMESPSMFSNARGLLSVDALVGGASPERSRQGSIDTSQASLNTRNLLCLRALLNLGIALGPTLDTAWVIILGTLQEADLVLFSSNKSGKSTTSTQKPEIQNTSDGSSLTANFGTEIKAVETAASRLLESTIDFPNEAFLDVVSALCKLYGKDDESKADGLGISMSPSLKPTRPVHTHRRIHSTSATPMTQNQEDLFALAKLGEVASINIDRLMSYDPEVSGWKILTSELISAACFPLAAQSIRLRAADILVRIVLESATASLSLADEARSEVQLRLLESYNRALTQLRSNEEEKTVSSHATDIDVHKIILDGLKSVLEQCGESFISGWEITFEIIGSVFEDKTLDGEEKAQVSTISSRLIRPSFNSLQLICSDFLSSLPNSCFLKLVDTLYNFCSQNDDLNISLTVCCSLQSIRMLLIFS
jgi:hypothetical protein